MAQVRLFLTGSMMSVGDKVVNQLFKNETKAATDLAPELRDVPSRLPSTLRDCIRKPVLVADLGRNVLVLLLEVGLGLQV